MPKPSRKPGKPNRATATATPTEPYKPIIGVVLEETEWQLVWAAAFIGLASIGPLNYPETKTALDKLKTVLDLNTSEKE